LDLSLQRFRLTAPSFSLTSKENRSKRKLAPAISDFARSACSDAPAQTAHPCAELSLVATSLSLLAKQSSLSKEIGGDLPIRIEHFLK